MDLSLFQNQSHFLLRFENLVFVITATVSGLMLLWSLISQRGIKEIDTRIAVQLINYENALIVDVRDDSEYASGHLPNSKHIPTERMEERWSELEKYKDKPIVVIYRGGVRSTNASSILKKNGFSKIFNLIGGIDAWKRANLPIVKR
ncbi:MAG: rhodanese-like domain-containing protein [Nitrosomonas sp.]